MTPALARGWLRLARELRTRPLLRDAVRKGVVTPRKALTVLPVAIGREEPLWTAAAFSCTVAELEAAVRSEGREPPGDACAMELLWMRLSGPEQDLLDKAFAVARESLGPGAPRWQCLEVIAMEALSRVGAHTKEEEGIRGPDEPRPCRSKRQTRRWKRKMRRRHKQVARQLAALQLAEWVLTEEPPGGWNAQALHAAIRQLLAQRTAFDAAFGTVALAIVRGRLWEVFETGGFEAYCRERLGMAPSTVKQRVWLERRLEKLPALRDALARGRITYSKALVIARDGTPSDVLDRIADAETTTCRQTRKKSEKERARKDRAKGVRTEWAPREAAETWRRAVEAVQEWAQAERGTALTPGQAVASMAVHFVETYDPLDEVTERRHDLRDALWRNGGLCAVPGCSRCAVHRHHIVYRSRGGGNERENLIGLCRAHHLRGIHMGYVTVRGRAGEHLVWYFAGTGETWITRGESDVRVEAAG